MSEDETDIHSGALERACKIAANYAMDATQKEHELRQEIEYLQSSLTQSQQELERVRGKLREAESNAEEQANIAIRFLRRAESAEAKNLQLTTQVAVMSRFKLERREYAGEQGISLIAPDGIEICWVDFDSKEHEWLVKLFSNIPAEAEKLVPKENEVVVPKGWIDVKDRLPEYGQLIAVKWNDKSPKDYDCWIYSEYEGADWSLAVCWIPLPEAMLKAAEDKPTSPSP